MRDEGSVKPSASGFPRDSERRLLYVQRFCSLTWLDNQDSLIGCTAAAWNSSTFWLPPSALPFPQP